MLQAISYGSEYVFPSESYRSKQISNNIILYAEHLDYRRETNKSIQAAELKKLSDETSNSLSKFVETVTITSDEELEYLFERFEFYSYMSAVVDSFSALSYN